MEMQIGDLSKTLPDEILEKIIAMLPFPQIFKARALSRSWNARFEPHTKLLDEKEKRVAASFQKQVVERSNDWGIFCPLCTEGEDGDPVAYNQAERKWQRLPSLYLPFLNAPEENLRNIIINLRGSFSWNEAMNLQLEGPFLYGTWLQHGLLQEILVRNVLTGECKQLLGFPEGGIAVPCIKLVIDSSAESYKIIVVCQRRENNHYMPDCLSAHIYDSKSGSWSTKKAVLSRTFDPGFSDFAYINGVFYTLSFDSTSHLLAFNVEEGTLEEVLLLFEGVEGYQIYRAKLVAYNDNLVMIVTDHEAIQVLQIDLVSHRVLEVARCHGADMLDVIDSRDMINSLVFEANCLVVETIPLRPEDTDNHRIVVYNLRKDKWTFFSFPMQGYLWSECCFQPGLNPFIAV